MYNPEEFESHMGSSFDTIYKNHHKKLLSYVHRNLTKNIVEAEDVCSQTWSNILIKYKLYNSEYSFSTWLYKIAMNEYVTRYRINKKTGLTVKIDDDRMSDDDNSPMNTCNIEAYNVSMVDQEMVSLLITEKRYDLLVDTINKLPERISKVMKMWIIDKKKQREIAEELEINLSTIKSITVRGKSLINKMMKEDYYKVEDLIKNDLVY